MNKNTIKLELDINEGLKVLDTKLEHIYEEYITSSLYKNSHQIKNINEGLMRLYYVIMFKDGYGILNKE
jgi:hypothetical protein